MHYQAFICYVLHGQKVISSITIVYTCSWHVLSGSSHYMYNLQASTPLLSHCHMLQMWYKQLEADVSEAVALWVKDNNPYHKVMSVYNILYKYKESCTVNSTKLPFYVKCIRSAQCHYCVALCREGAVLWYSCCVTTATRRFSLYFHVIVRALKVTAVRLQCPCTLTNPAQGSMRPPPCWDLYFQKEMYPCRPYRCFEVRDRETGTDRR